MFLFAHKDEAFVPDQCLIYLSLGTARVIKEKMGSL